MRRAYRHSKCCWPKNKSGLRVVGLILIENRKKHSQMSEWRYSIINSAEGSHASVNLIRQIHTGPVLPYPKGTPLLRKHHLPNEALSRPLPHSQHRLPACQRVPLQIQSMEQLVKLERMQGMRSGPSAAPWPEMLLRLSSRRHLPGIMHEGCPELGEGCSKADIKRELLISPKCRQGIDKKSDVLHAWSPRWEGETGNCWIRPYCSVGSRTKRKRIWDAAPPRPPGSFAVVGLQRACAASERENATRMRIVRPAWFAASTTARTFTLGFRWPATLIAA